MSTKFEMKKMSQMESGDIIDTDLGKFYITEIEILPPAQDEFSPAEVEYLFEMATLKGADGISVLKQADADEFKVIGNIFDE